MNFDEMELSELKEYAKTLGLPAGNIGKEKLIEKIREKEAVAELIQDDDLAEDNSPEEIPEEPTSTSSLIDSISDAIDEMDESSDDNYLSEEVDLSLNESIPVKSITFGALHINLAAPMLFIVGIRLARLNT